MIVTHRHAIHLARAPFVELPLPIRRAGMHTARMLLATDALRLRRELGLPRLIDRDDEPHLRRMASAPHQQ